MLTHNALNLASKTEEVLRYIEIVSVTGKVPSSSMGMLSYGMLEKISTTSIKFKCVRPNKDSIRPRHDNNITLSLRYIFIETSFLEVCCAVIMPWPSTANFFGTSIPTYITILLLLLLLS